MTSTEDIKKRKLNNEIYWHPQHENILKVWGEQSACYRWMHYKAYEKYKMMSLCFTLPIIVISTVTGTANFAQETFPPSWKTMAPVFIGGLNLFAAIMTTVLQFLKVNELLESHRVSSIQYGKLSRQIRLQLTLPIYERSHDGDAVVENSNLEYDRLIEQSPPVPEDIIKLFHRTFPTTGELSRTSILGLRKKKSTALDIMRPEIIHITEISPYDTEREHLMAQKLINNTIRRNSQVEVELTDTDVTIEVSEPGESEGGDGSKVKETKKLFEQS